MSRAGLALGLVLASGLLACTSEPTLDAPLAEGPGLLIERYIERYFETFPTRATEAGLHELDHELGTFDPATLEAWTDFNREMIAELSERLERSGETDEDDLLDLELIRVEARRQVFAFDVRQRPQRDPLFWSRLVGQANVFLLVREDRPRAERVAAAAARAALLPRALDQARQALAGGDRSRIAPQHCALAARQTRALAGFYRDGFPETAEGLEEALAARVEGAAARAAEALAGFADFLDELEGEAAGSPRLGDDYRQAFRHATGVEDPIDEVLERALVALAAKRAEAAEFARSVWHEVLPGRPQPDADVELLRAAFARLSSDRAATVDEFVADYRRLIEESVQFVRERDVITLPEPLSLAVDPSPGYLLGQSVGGVYPAGPWAPDADSILFLPVPPDTADAAQRDAFFRDFNDHFNLMITPHEVIPGHYLQLKFAAAFPRKARALFPDEVYVEGWGTFCERLLLDLGWGGPLDRLAHLKKQLENIARTIVDIRVHTTDMTREEVLAFVVDEALQDRQFAENMWRRSITTAPQLTYYLLGYEQVQGLYDDVRERSGGRFRLRDFMDGMMGLGPVPVRHYRRLLLR